MDYSSLIFFGGGFGVWEVLLVLVVILIFFGARKIPELAKGMGKGIKEFKNATQDDEKDEKDENEQEDKQGHTDKNISDKESDQKSQKDQ